MHILEWKVKKAVKKDKERQDQALLDKMLAKLKSENERRHKARIDRIQAELDKLKREG